jgi:hypothetical protein
MLRQVVDQRVRGLRTTLAWFEVATGRSLDACEEAIVSKRPADSFGGAQPLKQIRLGLVVKQIGETRRSAMGAKAVIPSSLPRRWARVLDHRQSPARSTSRARSQ